MIKQLLIKIITTPGETQNNYLFILYLDLQILNWYWICITRWFGYFCQ